MEIKDKPSSMSVREWITKKVATTLIIPENVIRRVISHNYDSAYEALEKNKSIEISGFGKFYYNEKKADKEIIHCIKQKDSWKERLECEDATEKERREAESKIAYYSKKLAWIEEKKKNGED